MNAPSISSMTTTLVTRMLARSLRRIGTSARVMPSALPRRRDLGDAQQFRAHREAGIAHGVDVDAKPHVAVGEREPDHAALLEKSRVVAHGQRAAMSERRQDLAGAGAFGAAD